jgi:hypothetical protein
MNKENTMKSVIMRSAATKRSTPLVGDCFTP